MFQQASDTLDMTQAVQAQLGAMMWENLVLRAQLRELQTKLAAAQQPSTTHHPTSENAIPELACMR